MGEEASPEREERTVGDVDVSVDDELMDAIDVTVYGLSAGAKCRVELFPASELVGNIKSSFLSQLAGFSEHTNFTLALFGEMRWKWEERFLPGASGDDCRLVLTNAYHHHHHHHHRHRHLN